jgi:hypothetical protein
MSSSVPTPISLVGDASNQSLEVLLVHCSGRSFARTRPASDAAHSVLRSEYPCWQRSYFIAANKGVLHHNYDIPASISLHFPDKSTGMIKGHADICVYERMFLVGVRLLFPPIV